MTIPSGEICGGLSKNQEDYSFYSTLTRSFTPSLSRSHPSICSIGLDILFLQGHPYWSSNAGRKFMLVLAMLLRAAGSLVYCLTRSQAIPWHLSAHSILTSMVFTQSKNIPSIKVFIHFERILLPKSK